MRPETVNRYVPWTVFGVHGAAGSVGGTVPTHAPSARVRSGFFTVPVIVTGNDVPVGGAVGAGVLTVGVGVGVGRAVGVRGAVETLAAGTGVGVGDALGVGVSLGTGAVTDVSSGSFGRPASSRRSVSCSISRTRLAARALPLDSRRAASVWRWSRSARRYSLRSSGSGCSTIAASSMATRIP